MKKEELGVKLTKLNKRKRDAVRDKILEGLGRSDWPYTLPYTDNEEEEEDKE